MFFLLHFLCTIISPMYSKGGGGCITVPEWSLHYIDALHRDYIRIMFVKGRVSDPGMFTDLREKKPGLDPTTEKKPDLDPT